MLCLQVLSVCGILCSHGVPDVSWRSSPQEHRDPSLFAFPRRRGHKLNGRSYYANGHSYCAAYRKRCANGRSSGAYGFVFSGSGRYTTTADFSLGFTLCDNPPVVAVRFCGNVSKTRFVKPFPYKPISRHSGGAICHVKLHAYYVCGVCPAQFTEIP